MLPSGPKAHAGNNSPHTHKHKTESKGKTPRGTQSLEIPPDSVVAELLRWMFSKVAVLFDMSPSEVLRFYLPADFVLRTRSLACADRALLRWRPGAARGSRKLLRVHRAGYYCVVPRRHFRRRRARLLTHGRHDFAATSCFALLRMASSSLRLQVSTQASAMGTVTERAVYFYKASMTKIDPSVRVPSPTCVHLHVAHSRAEPTTVDVVQNVASVVYMGELGHNYLLDGIYTLRVGHLLAHAGCAFHCCSVIRCRSELTGGSTDDARSTWH
jgi:hypothetical protein